MDEGRSCRLGIRRSLKYQAGSSLNRDCGCKASLRVTWRWIGKSRGLGVPSEGKLAHPLLHSLLIWGTATIGFNSSLFGRTERKTTENTDYFHHPSSKGSPANGCGIHRLHQFSDVDWHGFLPRGCYGPVPADARRALLGPAEAAVAARCFSDSI